MIHKISVCGAGTMGSGIAQVSAMTGIDTVLYDTNIEVVKKAQATILKSLEKFASKGKLKQSPQHVINKIHFTTEISDCKAELILEAIIEVPEIKKKLFHSLEEINGNETILATNTSSLSVKELGSGLSRPERFIGIHFFNPAQLMKLVEVVVTDSTSAHTLDSVLDLIKLMDKVPVVCKDSPGFIVNRVARPFYIESLRLAEQQVADIESIDNLLESAGFRMGPFRLMDLIGNDVNYAVSCSVYEQLNKPARLRPSHLQKENVDSGRLGKKSGAGFYNYDTLS